MPDGGGDGDEVGGGDGGGGGDGAQEVVLSYFRQSQHITEYRDEKHVMAREYLGTVVMKCAETVTLEIACPKIYTAQIGAECLRAESMHELSHH